MRRTIDKPALPLPGPLSGAEHGSFAHLTITERIPRIARETLAENDFSPDAAENLQQLIEEIPTAPIRCLRDAGAPDARDWREYVSPHLGKGWLEVPWFFAETYFYRRILEATGYYLPGPHQGFDPFLGQKARVLEAAGPSVNQVAARLEKALDSREGGENRIRQALIELAILNVWGNQADLSMWSADEDRPNHQDYQAQRTHLLVDDSEAFADHLFHLSAKPRRVDFILDNYGPELALDLALADYLLNRGIAERALLHAKPHPYFVSDATFQDVHRMLDWLATRTEGSTRALGSRLRGHLESSRLVLMADFFWTSPLNLWEMPDRIRALLAASDLVISKGDANYRRLAGDLKWPPTTPFSDVAGYFPAPLLALRVLKAELALGLSSDQVSRLDREDPEWRVNGQWGVIQFLA